MRNPQNHTKSLEIIDFGRNPMVLYRILRHAHISANISFHNYQEPSSFSQLTLNSLRCLFGIQQLEPYSGNSHKSSSHNMKKTKDQRIWCPFSKVSSPFNSAKWSISPPKKEKPSLTRIKMLVEQIPRFGNTTFFGGQNGSNPMATPFRSHPPKQMLRHQQLGSVGGDLGDSSCLYLVVS